MIQTLIKSIIRPREITEWCKCITDHEESEGFHREILGINPATSTSPNFIWGSLTVRMRSQILMILGETKGLNPKIQELQQLTYPKGASMGVFVIFGSCISCISF